MYAPIGVYGKSGTTKIWGGAFAPPHPLATPLEGAPSEVTVFETVLTVFCQD